MGPPKNSNDVISAPTSGNSSPRTRNKMKQYWQIYAPSLESMMLSHDAPHLSVEEQEEVMSYVPRTTYEGKRVLELGAGIGRYTTLLSKNGVRELTAVDFMESYVEENRKRNGHNSNISFLCADVTALEFAEGSFDMVFSNWLLMYLTDAEVDALLQRVLSWLTPQGHLFIRESCFHQSGNVKRAENPTFYRSPLQYATSLSRCCTAQGDAYRLVKAKSIQAYINHYRNPNQLCFLVQKTCTASGGGGVAELERRLSAATLLETVHGAAWGCRGGEAAAQLLAGRGDSVRGKTVLDANCGTGGLVALLAQQGAARVVGLTSSAVNLHLALLHLGSKGQEIITKTFFELSSLLEWQRRDKFDIVCAHDLPLNQVNGSQVLAKLKTLLKESGQMFISVYTSDIATADLVSATELKAMAAKAGFSRVATSTNTEFLPAIVKELSGCQVNNNATAGLPHVHRQEFIEELQLTVENVTKGLQQLTILTATI